jgi:hypothetical protein
VKQEARVAFAAGFAVLLAAGPSFAHHSFAGVFDADKVVNVKGVMVRFDWVNPHSIIYVESRNPNGEVERWALEGPSVIQLGRRSWDRTTLKAGDQIEACGYATKDGVVAPKSDSTSGVSSERFISAELLTLPSGEKLVWSNYGQRKCLEPR